MEPGNAEICKKRQSFTITTQETCFELWFCLDLI